MPDFTEYMEEQTELIHCDRDASDGDTKLTERNHYSQMLFLRGEATKDIFETANKLELVSHNYADETNAIITTAARLTVSTAG